MTLASPLVLNAMIAIMVFVTVMLVLWAIFGGREQTMGQLEGRISRMGLRGGTENTDAHDDEAKAREALQHALEELETLKRREGRFYLTRLLRSSGTERTLLRHAGISFGLAAAVFAVTWLFGLAPFLSLALATGMGVGLPIFHLRHLVNRRMTTFSNDLPGALDLIVRGIRAGLPLMEGLKLAADEWHDPLRSEFLQVTNDMGMGLSIREAIARFADRVPVQEARLFAIVIAIQAQSGGNLSEVLSNLADLLREKGKLQTKIRAMTSEARTSAWIIGSIPVLLVAAVAVLSPGFLQPLFETAVGNMILVGCGIWMVIGFVVMRTMMRVDL